MFVFVNIFKEFEYIYGEGKIILFDYFFIEKKGDVEYKDRDIETNIAN